MHKLHDLLCLFVLFALVTWAMPAQSWGQTPADSDFYNPIFGSQSVSFSPTGTSDDTAALSALLANVSSSGGGTVNIDAGNYSLRGVQLQSNTHLRIDQGAIIRPAAGTSRTIFEADSNNGPVTNFSVQGSGGRFNFDFQSLMRGDRFRAISFGNAENFRVSDFHVQDNRSGFSALAFGPNTVAGSNPISGLPNIQEVRGVPSLGIVENVSIEEANYGFGLVQVQGGNNLLFRNLEAEGGVALRLETGFERNQFVDRDGAMGQQDAIRLDRIYGRNINSRNGQAAVTLSPHTLDHGVVDIAGVTAESSEVGVVLASGFVSGSADSEQRAAGLTPGSFDSASRIRDVTVTFGQDALLRTSRLRFLPEELRVLRENGVGISDPVNDEAHTGPSVGSALLPANYQIDFSAADVEAIGFNIEDFALPPNAVLRDEFDDFEGSYQGNIVDGVTTRIDGSRPGSEINFRIPQGLRGTPNRQLALASVPEPSGLVLIFAVSIAATIQRRR